MFKRMMMAAMLAVCGGVAQAADRLEAGFAAPPDSARPWVYWFVMDGNLSREGITADFEAMHRAGIGGVIFMEVNVGIPQGPVKFMSGEWRRLFKHAVAEAERLGLQITLNAGPGWTGSGGPWVRPEQSMQHVVASAVDVSGPATFDATLPRPAPRPAYFGNAGLPAEILQAKDEFYVDVAVLAVPQTDDAARIADIDEKALYVRHPYTSRPGTKPFLPAPAHFPALPAGAAIAADRVVDLTARLTADGRLVWDVPEGRWTILRFGRTSTGANTRPAPAPGLGLECDKFDRAALDAHFDAFIGTLLRDIGPRLQSADAGWNMLHIDSWEMGAQNWTAAFRDEFQRRRGYDLLRYLPAVTGRVVESLEISERFLWDLRQTAQELVIENHAMHLRELGRRHGFGLSIEPYDMNPCSDMSLGAVADVPMCEFWLYGFNSLFSVIEAASVAHTCGRPIVAAEAFTSSAAERWQAHPASMKALGDWAFCAGVNRIVFHRYQHQPWLDRRPGMTMGPYGVHWESTQTWWPMVDAYHRYLARCQFLLRQGLPVADVCYLAAEGAPLVFRPPSSATHGDPPSPRSYHFDGCAPETFLARASAQDGQLVFPDGMSYRVLVLPERDTMTPALLAKVKDLVAAGVTVIGPRPVASPSLCGYPQCDDQVRQLADELWAACDGQTITEHAFGKGRVVWRRESPPEPVPEWESPLAGASWVWHAADHPAMQAPVGRRSFRRGVDLPADARLESARVWMTADNDFALAINGRSAGSGDNFHKVFEFDVTPLLKPGANELTVVAENGGDAPNPAGLIGALVVKFRDGRLLAVCTDRQWQSAADAQSDAWSSVEDLGPMGMAPWKLSDKPVPPEPEQYGDFAIVAEVLGGLGVPPDFETDVPLRYTHRRDGDAEIYFVANGQAATVTAECTFRVSGKTPEIWDPVTGRRQAAIAFRQHQGRTTVPLEFDPHGSLFVIFRQPAEVVQSQGRNFPEFQTLGTVAGPWTVKFDPQRSGPESAELRDGYKFESLVDWTQRPEDAIRYYSGTAVYTTTLNVPADASAAGQKLHLDLGDVRVMARVKLNGRDLGVVWKTPFRVEITEAVQPGENALEIQVANLWPNRLIGDQSLPAEQRYTWTTWNPFSKDARLLESGLLGPVTLQASEVGRFTAGG
jgi:hypothetical protein